MSDEEISYRHPTRIRKRNRRYDNDDIITAPLNRSGRPGSSEKHKRSDPSPINLESITEEAKDKIQTPIDSSNATPFVHPQHRQLSSYAVSPKIRVSSDLPPHVRLQKVYRRRPQLVYDLHSGPLEFGRQLKNFLKLPKAYKWCTYEWFYSNIDRVLLDGENDFQICLYDSFPELRTRRLAKPQWRKIRKLLGKPRRCSHSFLKEECQTLHKKRNKIRHLQQKRLVDPSSAKDLPCEIPRPLIIGTKVTAYLRYSLDFQPGLYSGIVEGVDPSNYLYRIAFEKHGVGSFSIPDSEVWSPYDFETQPIESYYDHSNKTPGAVASQISSAFKCQLNKTMHLNSKRHLIKQFGRTSESSPVKLIESTATIGGFSIKFLTILVQLTNLLGRKRQLVSRLSTANSNAELSLCHFEPFSEEFKEEYAQTLIQLEGLNKELFTQFDMAQKFARELAPEIPSLAPSQHIKELRRQCDEDARDIVFDGANDIRNNDSLNLISQLTSLMLQIKAFADGELKHYEDRMLEDTLAEIKSSLHLDNHSTFQNSTEVHISHIKSSLTSLGNFFLFSAQS